MKNDRLPWIGTIPMFICLLVFFASIYLGLLYIAFNTVVLFLPTVLAVFVSLILGIVGFVGVMNLPLPRKRKNPFQDLSEEEEISEGAWTKVYKKQSDKSRVVKQIYFCGWGHNDYTKHRAPVIGKKKVCGKWNPFVLSFLHNYMVLYQLIGLRRRLRFQNQIDAIPETYNVNFYGLRYEQPYILHELTPENCPIDIREQFKELNDQLTTCGMYLDDVHAKNVRIDEFGKIKIIDGELYSEGEEWVKSKLVVLVNGAMVSGMEPVLGFNRIVAWNDHRLRVDQVVKLAEIEEVA